MNELSKERNFSDAKRHIEEFSKKTPVKVKLEPVKESWFIFNHDVTGKEFNERLIEIKDHFIEMNNRQIEIVDEFRQIYNAFESLDREYISGIRISLESAIVANKKAEKAQENIEKTLDTQKRTIDVFGRFKERIESLEHLKDIDEQWIKLGEIEEEISRLKIKTSILAEKSQEWKEKTQVSLKIIEELSCKIESIQEKNIVFCKHIDDIQNTINNLEEIGLKHTESLQEKEIKIKELDEKIVSMNQVIEVLSERIMQHYSSIQQYQANIDEMQRNYDLQIKQLKNKLLCFSALSLATLILALITIFSVGA